MNKATKPPSAQGALDWRWALAASALLVVACVSAALGWLVATTQYAHRDQQPKIPVHQTPLPIAPQPNKLPPEEPHRPVNHESSAPTNESQSLSPDSSIPVPEATPPGSTGKNPDSGGPSRTPKLVPEQPQPQPPPRPALPLPPVLACRSTQGLLLVDAQGTGRWRALQGPFVLREPAKIISLAESWSTIDIPGFGTLIWDGPAEAELSVRADGLVEIRLTQGRVGIQAMAAGAQIRFETGGANWTARALEGDATWAVMDDPVMPAMVFATGAIGIETLKFGPKQVVRWQEGVPAVLPSNDSDSVPAFVPALGNPWDLGWLRPPDETRSRQWRRLHGQLVNRLAAADDARDELKKMLAGSKELRLTALLSQWSLALADEAGRAKQNWDMLSDRREAVRIAGIKSLLQLPPGDPRQVNVLKQIRQAVDAPTSDRIAQWLAAARQPIPLPDTQAAELANDLQHPDLAVRQIAVSLLEMHTAPAFVQARLIPPAYDAAGPDFKRAAAQMEWRKILRQLYSAARNNGALFPLKPIPQQPVIGPGAVAPGAPAPQNAAPGGT